MIRFCNGDDRIDRNIDIGWEDLAPKYKKYRIKYLWFRARCVYNMVRFVFSLNNNKASAESERDLLEAHTDMQVEEDEYNAPNPKLFGCIDFKGTIMLWLYFMSCLHWANLITTPIIMIWPQLFPSPDYMLWFLEVCFMFDMVRKSLVRTHKPDSDEDFYDIFIDYLRSTMILDLIATVP